MSFQQLSTPQMYRMTSTSKIRSSLASFKMAYSPTFLPIRILAMGEMNEILCLVISASSTPMS